MATQIFGRDHAILMPRPVDGSQRADEDAGCEIQEPRGGALRGFVFAMLFNLLLVLAGVAVWQVWRILR